MFRYCMASGRRIKTPISVLPDRYIPVLLIQNLSPKLRLGRLQELPLQGRAIRNEWRGQQFFPVKGAFDGE